LFSTAATLASTIALQFQDASPLQVASLGALAVILMALTAIVNWFGRRLVAASAYSAGVL
jgi:ABC-type phosphate transport system permease subunit